MLRDVRKERGLSQYELSVKAGVNVANIRNWEQKGIEGAKVGLVKKVAAALGCTIEDLL